MRKCGITKWSFLRNFVPKIAIAFDVSIFHMELSHVTSSNVITFMNFSSSSTADELRLLGLFPVNKLHFSG
jgi:hypothetical protein